MKKWLIVSFILLASSLVACTSETTSTTTTTNTEESTTTTTYDPLSLMANIPDDCPVIDIVSGWIPVWCEEFNYTGGVDATKWSHQNGGGGFGNNELQYYTSRAENAYVDGEKLIITALKESYSGSQYTSSKIWTSGKVDWTYGKFEMRAKLPSAGGTWPAFWMMPTTSSYGGWPNSGEIDIMEHVGNNLDTVVGSIHTEKYNHILGTQISSSKYLMGLSTDFHTYSVTWNEYSMSWYVDQYKYGTTLFDAGANTDVESHAAWPFDKDFYLILNLAMGGNMGGTIESGFVSDTFEIDYVRVYERDYATGDTTNPTPVRNVQSLRVQSNNAYVIWDRSTDTNATTGYGQVAGYRVLVDGTLVDLVSLNSVHLTNLTANTTYQVQIQAYDYAGNLSTITSYSLTTPLA